MNVLLWLLYFIPALVIELVCYLLAPIVACFVRTEFRMDYVKRRQGQLGLLRDYIIKPLYWFQTHDNAVDEWWYGMYNIDHWFAFARNWTEIDYISSPLVRYYCRLMWLWRNCAYGFHYALFSRPKETACRVYCKGVEGVSFWYELKLFKSSFQFECQVPLGARYLTINIGWKAHKQTDRLLYANRIVGFRKYK